MSDSTRLFKLRDGAAVWREMDGETVLLDVAMSTYFGVNRSGTLLWSALVEGDTRDGLVGRLAREFAVTEEQVSGDVDGFLAECVRLDLIEREP